MTPYKLNLAADGTPQSLALGAYGFIVMRSVTGTVRIIKGEHRQLEKFHLD